MPILLLVLLLGACAEPFAPPIAAPDLMTPDATGPRSVDVLDQAFRRATRRGIGDP